MKKYLRLYLINLFGLWAVKNLMAGVSFGDNYKVLLFAALALTICDLVVKPIINLLLLPLNILSLGIFRWLTNVIGLYLVTLVVPQFEISSFNFPGVSFHGFVIPSIYLTQFWSLVTASFLISLLVSFILWLIK